MGKKKQDGALGKAIIKNRFGGGRKAGKESHVSSAQGWLGCQVLDGVFVLVLCVKGKDPLSASYE